METIKIVVTEIYTEGCEFVLIEMCSQFRTKIHNRISVALLSESDVKRLLKGDSSECCIVGLSGSETECDCTNPVYSLVEIFKFVSYMQRATSSQAGHAQILVCTGLDQHRQARVLFNLGCHLLMSNGLGYEETLLAFRPFTTLIASHGPGQVWAESFWRAICCAKCLNWIDFKPMQAEGSCEKLHMDEYIHYAR